MQVRDAPGAEAAAIRAVAELRGKHVLDVGCGKGRLTAVAAADAAYVYAFDTNADAVAAAQAAVASDGVRFAVHDIDALDVERERFDLALCGWSL